MCLLAARPAGRWISRTRTNECKEYHFLTPDKLEAEVLTHSDDPVSDVRVGVQRAGQSDGAGNS